VTTKTDLPEVPAALADAALIDGPTCAATGHVSVSWWNDKVSAGEAPQPVIRQPRFTRWRLADVARFWREIAERGSIDARVTQQAARASAKAREPDAVAKAQATRRARINARQAAQAGA
jgi:hypothetical protein